MKLKLSEKPLSSDEAMYRLRQHGDAWTIEIVRTCETKRGGLGCARTYIESDEAVKALELLVIEHDDGQFSAAVITPRPAAIRGLHCLSCDLLIGNKEYVINRMFKRFGQITAFCASCAEKETAR